MSEESTALRRSRVGGTRPSLVGPQPARAVRGSPLGPTPLRASDASTTKGIGRGALTPSPGGTGVPAGGVYGPMLSQRRGATSRFYHPSVLGTIETLTDASASVTDSYILTAFGVQVASTGSTTNPHRYIGALGYYTDPALGLDYVRARYLRPSTGSWLSVDPVLSEPRYAYVRAGVTRHGDPSGLYCRPSEQVDCESRYACCLWSAGWDFAVCVLSFFGGTMSLSSIATAVACLTASKVPSPYALAACLGFGFADALTIAIAWNVCSDEWQERQRGCECAYLHCSNLSAWRRECAVTSATTSTPQAQ